MIKIHWTHLAIILALVIGIFVGSQMQWSSSIAMAQDTNGSSYPFMAMTVYNNTIFIARGNTLFALKMIDHPILRNQKMFIPLGRSNIDGTFQVDTTGGTNSTLKSIK